MFPASDLVHPFEAEASRARRPDLVDGHPLDLPEFADTLRRICGLLGIAEPQVYVSPLPGHAYAPGVMRIAEQSLAELAPDEVEALLAHVCGHLLLPGHAGELSADRVAALYQGSPDAITRVIFAEAVHSGPSPDDLTVRVREIQAWTATAGFARLASLIALPQS